MTYRFLTYVVVILLMLFVSACGGGGGENKDTLAPVITLLGDNPMSIDQDTVFTDPGATVSDNVDTGLLASVTGTVDTAVVGDYVLTYSATDAAGNNAIAVTRTVNVVAVETLRTGHFSGTIISGLNYTTLTHSGTTDQSGAFLFELGEVIVFSLGDTVIGQQVPAKIEMNAIDLVPDAQLYASNSEVRKLLSLNINHSAERRAFNEFNNILSFLQTLDADANQQNGIEIVSGVAELFANVQIDFADEYDEFDNNLAFRKITHQAADMGFIVTADITKFGYALDQFYTAQDITHNLFAIATTSVDTNADGNMNKITTYTYDGSGNQTVKDLFDNTNTISHQIISSTYDANGNILKYGYDYDADGTENSNDSFIYDSNANLLSHSYDWFADGNADLQDTYTYDASGNTLTHLEIDSFAGNVLSTYTYDEKGNQLTFSYDIGANGSVNRFVSFTYDNNGNKLSESGGNSNYIIMFTYNANNQLEVTSSDTDGDGTVDRIHTNTYDTNGNRVLSSQDNDADGSVDSTISYAFDVDGNLLTESYDNDGDGNSIVQASMTYDANGNILTVDWDDNVDGIVDAAYSYTYDANDNLLTSNADYDGDGISNSIRTYTYDTNGNREICNEDSNADGNVNRITYYTSVSANWRAMLIAQTAL